MQRFNDRNGHEWFIELNIATARRIRQEMAKDARFDQFDFLDYAGILAAVNDVFFAADLLYVVCKEQADALEITTEEFGASLKGKYLFDAIAAFVAEYLDFFPDPTVAEKMRAVVDATREKQAAIRDAIIEVWTEKVDEALEAATAKVKSV